jgi:hypothetical protein
MLSLRQKDGSWSGTGEVTVSAVADNTYTLTMEGLAWDSYTLLSADPFEIL